MTPNALSQSLHMSYIRFRYLLHEKGLAAAEISLHLSDSNPKSAIARFTSMFHRSETELLRHWMQDTSTFISNSSAQAMHTKNKIVSQCPDIPEEIQRPVWRGSGSGNRTISPVLKSAFLNVAEGAHDRSRRQLLQQWFSDQANEGVSFIGLCELNGWQQFESASEFKYNFPRIRRIASESGYAHSHVMTSSQPYNIGIISAVAFEVVGEYLPPLFQRGLLHVFFPSLGVHVFVTHLHAHSSHLRERESTVLASLVSPIIQQNEMKVIVMGDLNTLSVEDEDLHNVWLTLFNQHSMPAQASSPIIKRLQRKFCLENSTMINYKPFQILSDVGLKDSCSEFCKSRNTFTNIHVNISINNTDYRKCYEAHCSYSEPTKFNPEVFKNEYFGCLV